MSKRKHGKHSGPERCRRVRRLRPRRRSDAKCRAECRENKYQTGSIILSQQCRMDG
jgi:hypothetical protein